MKFPENSKAIYSPSVGEDNLKIFLSNLDGRINTEDLYTFFRPFGTIEHIESWTPKSAIILFSNEHSIDHVLSKYRNCTINNQEIFLRRIRYGYIERAYLDSTVLFVQPSRHDSSIQWNEISLRNCFYEYEMNIEHIRMDSRSFHAYITFDDYDTIDRILLLRKEMFKIDGISMEMRRAKCKERFKKDKQWNVEKLVETNRSLKKQIERHKHDSHYRIQLLQRQISQLKSELSERKSRH